MIKAHKDLYKRLYYTIFLMQVMFLPQTPLAAPGPTLLEQIIYPHPLSEAAHLDHAALESILHQVKLQHLLQRAQGLWTLPLDWTGMLLGPLGFAQTLKSVLHEVKLQHLLQRAQGLWTLPQGWTGTLLGPLNAVAMAVCTPDSAPKHRLATRRLANGCSLSTAA